MTDLTRESLQEFRTRLINTMILLDAALNLPLGASPTLMSLLAEHCRITAREAEATASGIVAEALDGTNHE